LIPVEKSAKLTQPLKENTLKSARNCTGTDIAHVTTEQQAGSKRSLAGPQESISKMVGELLDNKKQALIDKQAVIGYESYMNPTGSTRTIFSYCWYYIPETLQRSQG
jgi:hypothetical protein